MFSMLSDCSWGAVYLSETVWAVRLNVDDPGLRKDSCAVEELRHKRDRVVGQSRCEGQRDAERPQAIKEGLEKGEIQDEDVLPEEVTGAEGPIHWHRRENKKRQEADWESVQWRCEKQGRLTDAERDALNIRIRGIIFTERGLLWNILEYSPQWVQC